MIATPARQITAADLIGARAAALASVAHAGQFRRGGVVPYFSHPEAVAAIVARFLPDDADAIAAAYLHDVVEDCGVAPEEIARRKRDLPAPPVPASQSPWEALYREKTGQLADGATLDFALAFQRISEKTPRHKH